MTLTPVTRQYFENLIAERAALVSVNATTEPGKSIAEEYIAAVNAEVRKVKPRAKRATTLGEAGMLALRHLGPEWEARDAEIAAPFKARIAKLQDEVDAARKRIDAALNDAAPILVGEIRKTAEPTVVFDFLYGGTYASQGYGSHRYSMAHLNRIGTTVAAQYGVTYKIAEVPGGWNVLVNVESATDVEIMKRAAQPVPLREFVRCCWAQGVNPRVMNPYIPVGYEEAQGLDYFGHDLRKDPNAGPYRDSKERS